MAAVLRNIGGDSDDPDDVTTLNFGVAYRPAERFVLAADINDFFDARNENLFNKIHLGVEYNMRFLRLRGGFSEGYPAFGVGLNFAILKLDYAFYSNELTNAPGVTDDKTHTIRIHFGWR